MYNFTTVMLASRISVIGKERLAQSYK